MQGGAEEAFSSRRGRMWTKGQWVGEGRKMSIPTGDKPRKSVFSTGKDKTEVNIIYNMTGPHLLQTTNNDNIR